MRKPFDVLAEGLLLKYSRGDWTPLELFLAGTTALPLQLSVREIEVACGRLSGSSRSVRAELGRPPAIRRRASYICRKPPHKSETA
jgi:hypothetical protein